MSDLTSQYIIAQEEHDYNKKYEEGAIVKHTIDDVTTAYTAKKNVPQFISILNENYWKKIASTTSSGEGIDIFDEDVEATDTQRNKALANVSNQTANSSTGKMGYKVLDPTKTFAEQVTADNTIYEIRDVFNGIGTSLSPFTMPSNAVIKLNGGKITNSYIEGNVDIVTDDYSKVKGVFLDGYNIAGRDSVESINIGLIDNDSNYASFNNRIIQNVINNCSELNLTDKYYITGIRTITNSFTIKGGTIEFTGDYRTVYFEPLVNSEIVFDGVTIVGNEHEVVKTTNNLNYEIKRVEFRNCVIYGTRPLYINCVDQLYENTPYGIKFLIIKNNRCLDCQRSLFIFGDGVVSKQFLFKGNYIEDAIGICINIGATNEYSSNGLNKKYQCDFVVEDNVFKGKYWNSTSYYCPCLFEVNRVFFRRNIVEGYIMAGTGIAYDSYVCSNEYYFENNYIKNVCNLPSTGTPGATSSELFKSKGGGSVRKAINNKWEIDFDECRQLIEDKYNITFTDEQFEAISKVSIFGFTSTINSLIFEENEIIIKGGTLRCASSSRAVVNADINRNIFNLEHFEGILLPCWNEVSANYNFIGNNIAIKHDEIFAPFRGSGTTSFSSNCNVMVYDNVSNTYLTADGSYKYIKYLNNKLTIPKYTRKGNIVIQEHQGSIIIDDIELYSVNYGFIIYDGIGTIINNPGGSSSIQFYAIYKSNFIKITIPYFNYKVYYNVELLENSWKISDEFGITIDSGDYSTPRTVTNISFYGMQYDFNINTTNKYFTLKFYKDGGSGEYKILRPFTVEFLSKNSSIGTWNAGTTRYNPTAGRMELWNGTTWVNLDGTALS